MSIKKNNKGEPNYKKTLVISEPVPISVLKEKAKSMGVSINELFGGAVIKSFSHLNSSKANKPSQFNAIVPCSMWPHD